MFPMNEDEIKKQIFTKGPGFFRLYNKKGTVLRVGMHESDLMTELLKFVKPKYESFDFKMTNTDKTAWFQLCEAFHFHKKNDFLESDEHPTPPKGKFWTCHVCEDKNRY